MKNRAQKNKGHDGDMKAQKLDRLKQQGRDMTGGWSWTMPGFGTDLRQCICCGSTQEANKTAAWQIMLSCRTCNKQTLHERIEKPQEQTK